MSESVAAIRNTEEISDLLQEILNQLKTVTAYRNRELLLTQAVVLIAMQQNATHRNKIRQIHFNGSEFVTTIRDVRPIPQDDDFFENVWRGYREHKNIY